MNITFRNKTDDSDFSCRDGELQEASNVIVKAGSYPIDLEGAADDIYADVPAPEIDFALVRSILPEWHALPDNYPEKTLTTDQPSMDYWTKAGSEVLTLFKSEAEFRNLFVAPFFASAAWKTMAGNYLAPVAPTLLIPNSNVPLVTTDGEISSLQLSLKVAAAVCSLYCKMKASEILRDWVGKIKSLEILVSEPLQNYDSFHAFLPIVRATTDNYCVSLDPATGIESRQQICTQTLPLAWKAIVKGSELENTDTNEIYSSLKFHPFASIPLREADLAGSWHPAGLETGKIIRSYGTGITFTDLSISSSKEIKSQTVIIEGKGEDISVITRPLKLTGADVFKKAIRVYLRGDYDPSALTIRLHASHDMMRWWCIAERKGGTMVFLPRSSFRFYKLEITGRLDKGNNLQGFSITI